MNKKRLFLFMLGQLGMMMLARFFFQWIMSFSNLTAGDGTLFIASTVGSVLLGFRIFDGVTDPLAGMISDWWVRKGQQRQTLLWFAFFLSPIGLLLCFSPTAEMSVVMRWSLLVAGFVVFFIGYTMYAIPYWSLVDDYAGDSDEDRRALSNMLGLGLILATIIGFVISPILVEVMGFLSTALVFSILAMLFMLAPVYAAPEQVETVEVKDDTKEVAVFSAFLHTFKNLQFMALLCLLAGSQMSFTVLTAAAPFIAKGLLGGSESDVSLLLGPLILTSLPMFYFAPSISKKYGWRRSLLIASLGLGVVYCCASAIGQSIIYSPTVTAMIIFGLGGPMIALLLAVEGDAIASSARESGDNAVSMYWGVFNLVVKGLNGLALFITGVLIDYSAGEWGTGAIRFMVISAGLMLFTGVALYFLTSFFARRQVK